MQLNALQRQLERIYEVSVTHDVADFVTCDRRIATHLGEQTNIPLTHEQLFVHDDGTHLDVSLYIQQDVVDRLAKDNPIERLHGGNLADFCTALEGVSHFLYLTWHAGFDREVSALELELQAEVDKYVSAIFLFCQQGDGVPSGLSRHLFDAPSFDERLDTETLKRYQEANYYAREFCKDLQQRFLGPNPQTGLMNEIRRFYRLTRWQKIDHIAATQGAGFKPYVHRH